MKSVLTTIALWCSLSTYCSGEIVFDWRIPFSQEKRNVTEQKIKNIAEKFTDKRYADFGSYNFITTPQKYTIQVGGVPFIAGYSSGRKAVMVGAYCYRLPPSPQLEIIVLHELTHAYDQEMGPLHVRYAVQHLEEWNREMVEGRACKKEYLLIEELKDKIPIKYYQKLLSCLNKDDYYQTYLLRGLLMKEWIHEGDNQ